jgi:hypothetical protein
VFAEFDLRPGGIVSKIPRHVYRPRVYPLQHHHPHTNKHIHTNICNIYIIYNTGVAYNNIKCYIYIGIVNSSPGKLLFNLINIRTPCTRVQAAVVCVGMLTTPAFQARHYYIGLPVGCTSGAALQFICSIYTESVYAPFLRLTAAAAAITHNRHRYMPPDLQ